MNNFVDADRLAGMDPLQRARYDAAVQRYHDTVAAHRATFDAQLRAAKNAVDELHRRHDPKRAAGEDTATGDAPNARGERGRSLSTDARAVAAPGPVRSILNKGG
ncbi:hypothetical protein ACFWGD_11690 [Corynebacterium sp. NPDC060344]|uniref:hypothetical protein n=1 Tax=Corynebacterium sp. NPDC060344 TaxID=3347101 RepID=UPI0036481C8E